MTYARDEVGGSNISDGGGGFQRVQAEHDLEFNWKLSLAQKSKSYPSGSNDNSGGGFHRVQSERDLESNWEVDLAQTRRVFAQDLLR
ncbi:condensin-2 complex subunit H2 [Pyrus ussuriensis x Pyrus communis]|uniref:Condensin-2 complex subunit H2 n=1 Tax=Pyrus ussuriensis x Pyrus communis TaxID=2448454 RepID=A0A5N5EYP0_9ROSA|nr:condensin-2 complex subunit H2 [Pyrus ussuriensis x Pyrus communis]